jgi:hypothetical protein
MRLFFNSFIIVLLIVSCKTDEKGHEKKSVNWDQRTTDINITNNFHSGKTYLPVYSEIYDQTDETTHLLTTTVSIRNTSQMDSLYIITADYYNTKGEQIRKYINKPIFLTPLETIEIVIPRLDDSGGTGANLIFDWGIKKPKYEPLFEAVMVWTTGTQGISFTTRGINYTN